MFAGAALTGSFSDMLFEVAVDFFAVSPDARRRAADDRRALGVGRRRTAEVLLIGSFALLAIVLAKKVSHRDRWLFKAWRPAAVKR